MLLRAGLIVLAALAASAPAPAAGSAAGQGFSFDARPIGPDLRERMVGRSWRRGCPVPLRRLRYLRVAYRSFEGPRRVGELVVHRSAAKTMRTVFARLYRARFPIRRMRLVDDYGADDHASIEADNTSAFNCRRVTGGRRWSEHAYGRAIDVNPIENPYVFPDGTTTHRRSRPYLRRAVRRPGMAFAGGPLVRTFRKAGWRWGGAWSGTKDYQHFSSTGR